MASKPRSTMIGGVPVRVHWSVFVLLALFTDSLAVAGLPAAAAAYPAAAYWLTAVACGVGLVLCLFAHEMSHAWVAKRSGLHVRKVTLWLLGGVAQVEGQAPTPRSDLAIAAVGPAVSLLCSLMSFGAAWLADALSASRLLIAALVWLGGANALIAVFNLLPGAPLDGGRVLRAALWWRGGDRDRAAATATRAGRVLGVVLAVLGAVMVVFGDFAGLWLVLLGLFLGAAAKAEHDAELSARTDVSAAEVMTHDPECAPGWYTITAFLDWAAEHGARRAYPVLDFEGRPAGVVVLDDLMRFPPPSVRRVLDVTRPMDRTPVTTPDAPAAALLSGLAARRGVPLALVIADGRLVGTINLATLAASIRLASLRRHFTHT